MQKWEYTTVAQTLSSKTGQPEPPPKGEGPINLNQLGEQGWELVAVVPVAVYAQLATGYTGHLEYIFKRPKGA